ncbi:AraC family transcriptional regulator [Vibrio parahaemolyticus]|nr:AraC family transcriptional regulator [Vibrio parahaemolyticus]
MCKNNKNLFESDIAYKNINRDWKDHVHLSDQCRERYLTQASIPELSKYDVFMAGLAQLSRSYEVERRGENVHTVLVTTEGKGSLITEQGVSIIQSNTITILPAGMPFRFELHKDSNLWNMTWFLLKPTERWQQLILVDENIILFDSSEQVWSIASLLNAEIGGRPAFRQLLLTELVRYLDIGKTERTTSTIRVQAIFNTIESQLHQTWKISDIAKQCFISEEQLGRICRSIYGVSPQAKLISLRMSKAQELLRYSDWPISAIANRVGYKDPYNFTHRFSRTYGVSPSKFRKRFN